MRLELHLSYACPQACAFCSEAERMALFRDRPVTTREIARVLAEKRRQGFDHLTLTGGEPTAHPDFLGSLRAARSLGYRTYVTSNGIRLAQSSFAARALPLIHELCLSLHGEREVHERLTGVPGSFERLLEAFRNAKGFAGVYLLANTVVTAWNWSSLEKILEMVFGLGARHWLVSNLAPEGRGALRFRELAVPLADWRRRIPDLARLAEGRGNLRFFGLPLCVLGPYQELSNDLYFSPRVTVERARGPAGLAETPSPAPTRNRVQPRSCAGCAARRLCGGVFERYAREFGTSELEPVHG